MKQSIIGLKELRENIETYISRVKKGDSFIVVRRSKPVFKISHPDKHEEMWEAVTDEFAPTSSQKKALSRAEANLKHGKTLSYNEVAKKLGLAD